ncbi:MAG: DNA polymerase I [Chitinispirillales bacterium]|jgi:DNA polymerase-1|nr:DNA polymerase I [Chitinispirillales bacterium]
MNEKKLYLIDGHALAYRAYYALAKNQLVNSKGIPTSAVYGFANYLLRLIDVYNCPYMAVVMDSSQPTFRHEAYPQYKANRKQMPEDLKTQIPYINELISAFNIPVVMRDGLEADDLIAVLTHKATASGFDVFLVTKDKDLMQLVSPNVTMLAPEGTGVFQTFGPDEVYAKMGIKPEQIVDYLALIGDSSDNIPGVPNIGPKSAVKILEKADVDQILADPAVLESPKLISKIEEYKEQLRISKMLATLKTDVDVDFEMDHLLRRNVDSARSLALLKELEFVSLMKNPIFGGGTNFEPSVQIVDSTDKISDIVCKIKEKGEVSIDLQIAGSLPRTSELVGITLALDSSSAFYIPLGHKTGGNLDKKSVLDLLTEIIESTKTGKIGDNFKVDFQVLRRQGLELRGIVFDTMLAAYLVDPGKRQYELFELVRDLFGFEIKTLERVVGKKDTVADLLVDEIAPFAAQSACGVFLVKEKLEPVLAERNSMSLFTDIELALEYVLADLEWQGMLVDTKMFAAMSKEYTLELEQIAGEIYKAAGEQFNLNSPKQMADVLFVKLGLPRGKKTKGGAQSTNAEILEKLANDYPIVQKILDYREKQKLLSTYIDALPAQILPETGRVHTSFNQAVAATGRLSSTNPNLQNIPVRTESGRKIREAFAAPAGSVLVSADYSQIELRILAHLSDDNVLVQAFIDDKDIHTQTASVIYGIFPEMVTADMRRAAKTINFGLMYGMGPIKLARDLKISFTDAKRFIDSYFTQFPSIRKYMDTSIQKARDLGYSETLLGRRRYLPEINAGNHVVREAAERTAINTPVQGTAADIIKIAMVRVHPKLNEWPGAKMLLQVHDELVFEVPQENADKFAGWVKEEMSAAYELKVPLKVDAGIGKHWGEAH